MAETQPIEIFFSYSPKDREWLDKLENHLSTLKRDNVITDWHEGEISAGQVSDDEIKRHLNSARIILLLISADFLASKELWQRDVTSAMERHDAKEACVIPVLLRPCYWETAQFGGLQALPRNRKPITKWKNQDEAFEQIAKEIRNAIQKKSDYISLPQETKRRFNIPWHSLRTLLIASMGVSALVVAMRFIGVLQPLELLFYDQMMQLKFSGEFPDDKLLLIQITEDDLKRYPGKGASLNDKTLSELLTKLLKFNARTIGLDLYRNFEAEKGSELERLLKTESRLFATCKVADTKAGSQGSVFPPEVPKAQIGFSDLLPDRDNVVRRQILQMDNTNIDPEDKCFSRQEVMDSFSLKLVQHYLSVNKKEYKNSGEEIGKLASGNVVLQPMVSKTAGGYISIFSNLDGYQVLLNYRSVCRNDKSTLPDCSLQKIAQIKSVKEALDFTDKDKKLVENKIVLIGTSLEGIDSASPTPFVGDPPLPGLIMQAQNVSQLLSAVLDNRPLLKVWLIWYEILWILAWSLLGGILALKFSSRISLIISGGTALLILFILCLLFFISPIKIWVPFVPSALTLLGTEGGVVVLIRNRRNTLNILNY